MSTGLTAADEFRHEPSDEKTWQENYMFLGWDEERSVGIYLHLGHLPGRGVVDARLLVSVAGEVVSAAEEFEADECLGVPWVEADIRAPLERWRLRCASTGHRGYDKNGWLAAGRTGGSVALGFDIEFDSVVPAVDYASAWAQMGVDNIFSHHYEAGCRWRGRVSLDGAELECSGMLIRDHSWGARDLKNAVQLAWWMPVVADDGKSFTTGTSLLRRGEWVGLMLEERGNGPQLISLDPWVRVDGLAVPGGFESASILHTRDGGGDRVARFESRLHTPVYYETMGSHRLDDVFSRVVLPDGRTGFGNLELNLPAPDGLAS